MTSPGGRNDVFVGVDIGTSATKTQAYDAGGRVVARARSGYPLSSGVPHRAEQDPDRIFEAVVETLAEVTARCRDQQQTVAAVAFSAAMHSMLALDAQGRLLTQLITWADNRAATEAERIRQSGGGLDLYRRTGTPLHPMAPLSKLVWFRRHEPEIFERAAHWISIKEYVLWRLFGDLVVDHSVASATGLFDIERLVWDEGSLEVAGVDARQLSALVPATHALSGPAASARDRLGLHADTPFIVGASDGTLANLGVGAARPGIAACTIGTSGAVRTGSTKPLTDPQARTFCYVLDEGIWIVGGAINNGGGALAWARDKLFPEAGDYERLTAMASAVPAGAEGVIFLPYLLGERAPYWNPDARAVFFGLSIRHGRDHLVRAVMEGVAFQMCNVLRVLEGTTSETSECRATGGFARSALWRQILADVFERPVAYPADHESSCFGAAIMAMKAVGVVDSLEAAEHLLRIEHRHEPGERESEVYRRVMPLFVDLYRDLEDEFGRLTELQAAVEAPEEAEPPDL
jgi:gluconokinase